MEAEEQAVLDVLSDGGRIWYEFTSGGLLLMDTGDNMRSSDTKLSIDTFLSLREKGLMVCYHQTNKVVE